MKKMLFSRPDEDTQRHVAINPISSRLEYRSAVGFLTWVKAKPTGLEVNYPVLVRFWLSIGALPYVSIEYTVAVTINLVHGKVD